jgi:hypothetical protein
VLDQVEAQNRFTRELESGERILWSGKPDNCRWLSQQDALLIPFSILWGGFAIFWEATALSSGAARSNVIFPLFGVPFVLVGLYLIIGRFFARRWVRRRTLYAVTDLRVIVVAPSWPRSERTTSVWLRSYPPVEKRLTRDGRGTLWIGSFAPGQRWIASEPGWPGGRLMSTNAIVFDDIPDAASVYAMIRRQLSDSTVVRATAVDRY